MFQPFAPVIYLIFTNRPGIEADHAATICNTIIGYVNKIMHDTSLIRFICKNNLTFVLFHNFKG